MNNLGYKAAKLIEKYGHVKRKLGSKEYGYCAIGALWAAVGVETGDNTTVRQIDTVYNRKMKIMAYMPLENPSLIYWNDKAERTPEEVMDLLIASDYLK